MKLIISTKRHFGDRNISRNGVQFEAHFVNSPTDTADDFKAMHELSNIVMSDCKEMGWFYGFGKNADSYSKNGRHTLQRETPLTPRERAMMARVASAENQAKQYKQQIDAMRIVLVRNGLKVCKTIEEALRCATR